MYKINKLIIIFSFFVIIFFPLIIKSINLENDLYGSEIRQQTVPFNLKNIFNNDFQSSLDKYIEQNLPGKAFLVRIRNELLYKLRVSAHEEINILKDNNLCMDESLDYYYHNLHYAEDEYIKDSIFKLKKLKNLLDKKNIKLSLVITPTKARYLNEDKKTAVDKILDRYSDNEKILPYEKLKDALKKTDIDFFDSIRFIEENKEKYLNNDIPLFYKTGHHWSYVNGSMIGNEYFKYLNEKFNLNFPVLKYDIKKSNDIIFPDSDLFKLLNIYSKEKEDYYKADITYEYINKDDINFIIRGGSFIGEFPVNQMTLNGDALYIENKICFKDKFKSSFEFDNYDEIDLKSFIDKTDILILEIQEINVYNMSFGFIDYLLSHEEFFEE